MTLPVKLLWLSIPSLDVLAVTLSFLRITCSELHRDFLKCPPCCQVIPLLKLNSYFWGVFPVTNDTSCSTTLIQYAICGCLGFVSLPFLVMTCFELRIDVLIFPPRCLIIQHMKLNSYLWVFDSPISPYAIFLYQN